MTAADGRDDHFAVVINDERQYSVWESERALPPGWSYAGMWGTRAACLDHIEEIWVDLRPRSLAEAATRERRPVVAPADCVTLVDRLCVGDHAVELPARPAGTVERLAEEIMYGYVAVRFIATRGGTELAIALDREASDVVDLEGRRRTGRLRVVGDSVLDDVSVRVVAEIRVPERTGRGWLERR